MIVDKTYYAYKLYTKGKYYFYLVQYRIIGLLHIRSNHMRKLNPELFEDIYRKTNKQVVLLVDQV
ncbi:MAG: hypothetical protein RMJ51_06050 [Candidatus Calescibacterium sp.]|nr:hypothetical protein [Candidatus Calescibacterium sp.]MCX7972585.1 hypothetical protein [bacterium]MDW8195780.1 hypothetical protein [Candidatus Calescibacterium sp.]